MIYFDNAATTPLDGEVLAKMLPYMREIYGNPQSQHAVGRLAAQGLMSARDGVAGLFGCAPDEVYFLSGGTEAGNLAVKGVCAAKGAGHLIISAIEHPAVYQSAEEMRARGFDVTFVSPTREGIIPPERVLEAIRPDTVFCAVMAVNNEVGSIQNVQQIGRICAEHNIFYYCDFVQAVGSLPFPTQYCSAFAVSSHKFYGPKGAAAMFVKKGSCIKPLISGGRQQSGMRGGTVNVAQAVGLYHALKAAVNSDCPRNMAELKAFFVRSVTQNIAGVEINGGGVNNIVNMSFDGCDGANILFCLDLKGICASTGSACSAGASVPSRVVTAIAGGERAKSAVRFSFGKYNTLKEAAETVEALKEIVLKIRG